MKWKNFKEKLVHQNDWNQMGVRNERCIVLTTGTLAVTSKKN